jgi:peptidyl-tRNA hydrolase
MRSVIERLGTEEFPRVRIGTGPLPPRWQLIDYVLSDITPEYQKTMFSGFEKAAEAVEVMIEKGISTAMNRFNRKDSSPVIAKPEKPGSGEAGQPALPQKEF